MMSNVLDFTRIVNKADIINLRSEFEVMVHYPNVEMI